MSKLPEIGAYAVTAVSAIAVPLGVDPLIAGLAVAAACTLAAVCCLTR